MSTPTPEILPCAHCGGVAIDMDGRAAIPFYWVQCTQCLASTQSMCISREDAIRRWNTRANPLTPADAAKIREALTGVREIVGCGCGGDYGTCDRCDGIVAKSERALALLEKATGGK